MHWGGAAADRSSTVDCQSLSPALLGAALFGATGSNSKHAAPNPVRGTLLAAARDGTLLLNEISNMPCSSQGQLQKLLEAEGHGVPDVRFVSTSSRRMEQLVETKHFRADLCYRLSVLPIEVPPLRKRLQDVPLLARYFLSHFELEGRSRSLSEEAIDTLSRYAWPGNIRELQEALEFAVAHSVDSAILPSHLPEAITRGGGADAEDEAFASSELNLARLERQAILRALQLSGFDKAKSARLLGIGKTTMYRKLKEMSGKTDRV
jgi:two-component system response regulator HydG